MATVQKIEKSQTEKKENQTNKFHISTNITGQKLEILKAEHKEYVTDKLNDQINVLAEEIS